MASPKSAKTSSSDLSNLPDDLLVSILERLSFVDDFRFRAVCRSWCSAATRCLGPPKPPSPWLLFCDLYPLRGQEACAFLSFPDGNKDSIRLPNVPYSYCIGSSDGRLVVVRVDEQLCLLNPISGAVITLPPFLTSPDKAGGSWFSYKAAVSLGARPSMGRYTVAMIQKYSSKLSVTGHGDDSWAELEVPAWKLVDVVFHHGQVFALAEDGTVVVCDLARGTCSPPTVTCAVTPSLQGATDYLYLVDSSPGGFLMALKGSWEANMIEAFVLDDGGEQWKKVENLRDAALFVGDHFSSLCVKVSGEFRSNCIYVSGSGLGYLSNLGQSVGVFDMESGEMRICHVNIKEKKWSEWSTIWFMPSLF